MKIYNHICRSCGKEYKGVNKMPSICSGCKGMIIHWYETLKVIEDKGYSPETLLEELGLK